MIGALTQFAPWVVWSLLLAAGVIMTGFYCGMETGIYVLNKIRLDLSAESGRRSARLLRRILDKPATMLAVLLVGTNLGSYLATFAVTAMFVQAGAERAAEWYSLAIATPVLFILAESVPKNVFQRLAESLVYRCAWLLEVSSLVLNACGAAPLVRGFAALMLRIFGANGNNRPLSQRGLAALVAEGHASGVLTHFQSMMVDRVIRIREVTLRDAMVPLAQVIKASRDASVEEIMTLIKGHHYTRLPLLEESGQVVAILDTYKVIAAPRTVSLSDEAGEPLILSGDLVVTDALYRMQRAHAAMAVVADRDARHIGIVTIKDLVEEIVGELQAW